jgi:hypothetical protein
MPKSQLDRFGEAVERKKEESKRASEQPDQPHGPDAELPPEQESRIEPGRPQDSRSVRAKNAGKGKKTADKWGS